MSLESAFAQLCSFAPVADIDFDAACDAQICPSDAPPIPCHLALLRARCPDLPVLVAGGGLPSLSTEESSAVVRILLQWVCCGTLQRGVLVDGRHADAFRAARLGAAWGLRDSHNLKTRLVGDGVLGKITNLHRSQSSLAEDLVRAYENGTLSSLSFLCSEDGEDNAVLQNHVVDGGWWLALASRSSYFEAMLAGPWAENIGRCAIEVAAASEVKVAHRVIQLQWPSSIVLRLMRFFHGAKFVQSPEDIGLASSLGNYFGISALFADVNDWIVANLDLTRAPSMWVMLEADALLREAGKEADVVDADGACFDYHVANFALLAEKTLDIHGNMSVPLHGLSYSLMYRVLASGLVRVPFQPLLEIVRDFVTEKCQGLDKEHVDLFYEALIPPRVLFNSQIRSALCGGEQITARTFAAGL